LVDVPDVRVDLAGVTHRARARVLVHGSDEDRTARRLLLGKYQRPGGSDLQPWGRRALAVAVDLVPQP
ncbi:MAG: hypothetical protein ACLGIO_04735, partial [Acidimicrobiia bacterium]